jgi:hypothetical protein
MKKPIILSLTLPLFFVSSLFADISNQTSNQKSEQESERNSEQKSINQSDTKTLQESRGSENSDVKTVTKNLSEIKSFTKSVTKSKSGNWSVNINPIPYILMEMRALGWDRRAFSLRNSDLGTTYYVDKDEEIIDLNVKAYNESKASTRGKMSKQQIAKIQNTIELLYFSGEVADKASSLMQNFYDPNIKNINELAKQAVHKAYNNTEPKRFNISSCNYGGSNDVYTCNDGEFTIVLTSSVPTLLRNGAPYYSAERIGFNTPSLTISFATNDSDAMSKVEQDSESRSVAQAVRQYTAHLEQQGQSEVASKIKTAMIEKALTSNLSTTASATVQAINSGSPTAVLKIFQ